MNLTFSHIDVLVAALEPACDYYARLFDAQVSKALEWNRDGFHVRYAVVRFGAEKIMLVQPLAGPLWDMLQRQGEGTIYRHCYSCPDIGQAYDHLVAAGVQPEDENGAPLQRDALSNPSGVRIIWLPRRFGNFSIEILEQRGLDEFMREAFAPAAA